MPAPLRRFALPALLLAGFAAAYALGLHHLLTLENLKNHRDELQTFARTNPVTAGGAFVLAYAAAVGFSLPVASLLTLLGGFVFGLWLGTGLVVIAATLGATLVFVAARSAFGDGLRKKVAGMEGRFSNQIRDNQVGFLLFLRLVPLFPFFVVNILPALFPVPLRTFAWTTLIGILPGSAVYVNIGRTLGDIDTLSDIISGQTLLALTLLGVLSLVPTAYNSFKKKA